MKRLALCTLAVASLFAASAPVTAQPMRWNRDAFWRGAPASAWDRIQFLQQRIDRGRADGSLRPSEAMRAQRELRSIRIQFQRMVGRDGRLGPREDARLQARLDDLSRRIRWLRHNGW